MKKEVINIIAPNIKTGGGEELLRYLLSYLENNYPNIKIVVYVDQSLLNISPTKNRSVIALSGKIKKIWLFCRKFDNAIYFGNLPPLRKSNNSVVYLHNLYLVLKIRDLTQSPIKYIVKYGLQQIYITFFKSNVDFFACQSMSVKNAFRSKYHNSKIELLPFYALCPKSDEHVENEFDLCYVSLSYQHKNHELLFEALKILEKSRISCSLALTVHKSDKRLESLIKNANKLHGISVVNLGIIPKPEVCLLYKKSKCLIFPSTKETFGLALVEAASLGMDIIAADMSYVHDVIQTPFLFDPSSASSCADAIKRYLVKPNPEKPKVLVQNKVDLLVRRFIRRKNV